MSVCAVVGGQYGSEGKGLIVAHIARQYGHHVRVGAANAGHTFYTTPAAIPNKPGVYFSLEEPDGSTWSKHVMQQLPCAAYANPGAELYIGPGALISPGILRRELELLNVERGPGVHVTIDPRAHVVTYEHIGREMKTDLAERIGSTSTIAREGIGAAQAARVMREAECVLAGDYYAGNRFVQLRDVPSDLSIARIREGVMLEGTQGYGLSTTTGEFPYVTSRNTTAAGLAADCGVAPNALDRVILVCRTFPIRVAGNSGPFHAASRELTWSELGVDPESERTTVTKKVRRVGTFSIEQVREAAIVNGATEIALTFCDYLDSNIAGACGRQPIRDFTAVDRLVSWIESVTGVPVSMLGTGPHSVIDLAPARHEQEATHA